MAKVDKWGDPRTWSEEDKQKLHQQSEQLVDSEYMNEIMGQLDESQRFGGKYGILAALGYGNPDDRADIRNYQRITGGLPSVMGAYYQRKAANMPIDENKMLANIIAQSYNFLIALPATQYPEKQYG